MKWYYLLLTSQEHLLKFLVYAVYMDDNNVDDDSELSVICMANIICCYNTEF